MDRSGVPRVLGTRRRTRVYRPGLRRPGNAPLARHLTGLTDYRPGARRRRRWSGRPDDSAGASRTPGHAPRRGTTLGGRIGLLRRIRTPRTRPANANLINAWR